MAMDRIEAAHAAFQNAMRGRVVTEANCLDALSIALAAADAVGMSDDAARRGAGVVPAGFKLVPVEPTIPMIEALARAAEKELAATSPTEGRMKVNFSHASVFMAGISASPPSTMLTEAEVRADEREKCAEIAEGAFAFEIDVWLHATKKEMTAKMGKAIAAAIRSADAISKEDKP